MQIIYCSWSYCSSQTTAMQTGGVIAIFVNNKKSPAIQNNTTYERLCFDVKVEECARD
jgi:hypothetical protein